MSRKIVKIIFPIFMILMIIFTQKVDATSMVKLGDINCDGKINLVDMQLILKHISSTKTNDNEDWKLTGEKLKLADITQDGVIDARDILVMQRYIAASESSNILEKHPNWTETKEIEVEEISENGIINQEDKTIEKNGEVMAISNFSSLLTSISLNKSKIEMEEGEKEKIVATVTGGNTTNNSASTDIEYSSSNESIAKVDQSGIITAIKEGTATITAKLKNYNKKATCKVEIKDEDTEDIATNTTTTNNTPANTTTNNTTTNTTATNTTATNTTATNTTATNTTKESSQIPTTPPTTTPSRPTTPTNSATYETTQKNNVTEVKSTGIKINTSKMDIGTNNRDRYTIVASLTPFNSTEGTISLKNNNPSKVGILGNIKEGTYRIISALDENKVLEIDSDSNDSGAAIKLNNYSNSVEYQKFKIVSNGDNYFSIISKASGFAIDVPGGSRNKGTLLQQYKNNGTDAQLWCFEDAGDGYYYIRAKSSGLYMDVPSSNVDKQLQIWTGNLTNAQKFKLEIIEKKKQLIDDGTYYIKTALDENKVLEVADSSESAKAAVQLNSLKNGENQKVEIINIGDGYCMILAKHSGLSFDVNGGNSTKGKKIQQYPLNGTNNQLWKFEEAGDGYYYIKSKGSDFYLDIPNSNTEDNSQIQIWTGNKTNAQKFKLESTNEYINSEKIEIITIIGKDYGEASIDVNASNGSSAKCNLNIYLGYGGSKIDSLYYIQYQTDGAEFKSDKKAKKIPVCAHSAMTCCIKILTGDYEKTGTNVLTPEKFYNACASKYGESKLKSSSSGKLVTGMAEQYGLKQRRISSGSDELSANGAKNILKNGGCIWLVRGDDNKFYKPSGKSRTHPKSHCIMFYKYDGKYFYAKDDASDGGAQCKYPESYMTTFLKNNAYETAVIYK